MKSKMYLKYKGPVHFHKLTISVDRHYGGIRLVLLLYEYESIRGLGISNTLSSKTFSSNLSRRFESTNERQTIKSSTRQPRAFLKFN